MLGCGYFHPYPPSAVARYARSRDYHKTFKTWLGRLMARLKEVYPRLAMRAFVDTGPLLEKVWAVKAGLGFIGKNGCLIHPRKGSWLLLASLLLDAPVDSLGEATKENGILHLHEEAIQTPWRAPSRLCERSETIHECNRLQHRIASSPTLLATTESPLASKAYTKEDSGNRHADAPADSLGEATTKDIEAMAKDSKAITKDSKAITKDSKATTKDNEATTKDSETMTKGGEAMAKDSEATTKDGEATTKDSEATTKDSEATTKGGELAKGGNDCGNCRACLDACPTGALLGDGRVDARRCLSFHTVENKGAWPEAVREKAAWVFGCDHCQEVCPHNREAEAGHEVFMPRPFALWPVRRFLELDEADYAQLLGTPLVRAKLWGLRRNAAYVLEAAHKKAGPA
jgi:epoxyqueuosine reductase QueG